MSDVSASDIFDHVLQLQSRWKKQIEALTRGENISVAQMRMLFYIQEHQPIRTQTIARHMHISPSAVSQLIDELVLRGYVQRTTDEHDRRIAVLSVSQAGDTFADLLLQKRKALFQKVMEHFTKEEMIQFDRLQRKMIMQLDQERNTEEQ